MGVPRDERRDVAEPQVVALRQVIDLCRAEVVDVAGGQAEPLALLLVWGGEKLDLVASIAKETRYAPAAAPFPERSFVKRPSSLYVK